MAPFYDSGKNGVKGRYIVILQDDVKLDVAADRVLALAARANLAASIKWKLPIINAFVALIPEEGLDILRSLPGVAYIEEDEIVFADNLVWGLDRIDRKLNRPDGELNINGHGGGINAYVIDSGINPYHNDFGGRASVGGDYVGDGQNGIDCNGHGTHCAGTVASTTYGVASQVNVIGMRTLDCRGSGYKSSSIAALNDIADSAPVPSIVSMSLGGSYSSAQNDAVQNCRAAGHVVVVSAGNDNGDACNKSPASAPAALTVGATDSTDTRASFSNYGTCVNIFAPGVSTESLRHDNNYGTRIMSGTSMSCPHVAGIAAVYASMGNNAEQVYAKIQSVGTRFVVRDPGAGSPNLLAYCE